MEELLKHLPPRPRSAFVRLGLSTALVLFSFVLLIGLQREGLLAFYILLPAVFVAAVLFNRGSGIYSAVLSTGLLYLLLTPQGDLLLPRSFILPLAGFAATAVGFAIVSEALRMAWERAAAAEQAKDLLLRELAHRTKNNLAIVTSILSMQAQLKSNPETRHALEKANARIRAIASAHEHFEPVEHNGRVEMRSYLEQLCAHLAEALRDVRPVVVKVDAAEVYLPAEQAVAMGLVVNELVTNALKHAFPDERAGTVEVVLAEGSELTLIVRDDGIGCTLKREGMGTRLIRLLAQQLGASVAWENPEVGCQVRIAFSATERRSIGNRAARLGAAA
jgi:two-component sensor histidine kinase